MIIDENDFFKSTNSFKKKLNSINNNIEKSINDISDYNQRIFYNLVYEDYEFLAQKILYLLDFISKKIVNNEKCIIKVRNLSTLIVLRQLHKDKKNIQIIDYTNKKFWFKKIIKEFLFYPTRFLFLKLFFKFFISKLTINKNKKLILINSPYTSGYKFKKLNEITDKIKNKTYQKLYIPNFQNFFVSNNELKDLDIKFLFKEHFISIKVIIRCLYQIFKLLFLSKNKLNDNLIELKVIRLTLLYQKSLLPFYESYLNLSIFNKIESIYNIEYFVTWWENHISTKCIFKSFSKNKSLKKIAYLGYPSRPEDYRLYLKKHDVSDNHLPNEIYFISDYFLKLFIEYSNFCKLKTTVSERYSYLKSFRQYDQKYILISLPIFYDQSKLIIDILKNLYQLKNIDFKKFIISLHPNLITNYIKDDLNFLSLHCKEVSRNCFNQYLPYSKCVITSNSGTSLESLFTVKNLIIVNNDNSTTNSFIPNIVPKKLYNTVNNHIDLAKSIKSINLNRIDFDLIYYRKLIFNI